MTDDPRVILTEYAERERKVAIGYVRDPQDVPRLLAAARAAFSFHERVPHHPDSDLHFEDSDGSGEWLCEGKPEGAVCESCVDGEGGERVEWPCDEYKALLAALTGKGADGAAQSAG